MLIVNPNLCMDRTIHLAELVAGNVHRTEQAQISLGGKGVNVARVARSYGRSAEILGFVPSLDAETLGALARAEGAQIVGVAVEGVARVASILLERSGRVTVLNEPGPAVGKDAWESLLAEVRRHGRDHASLSCSGSLPPGSPVDAYARVVAEGRTSGLRTVVDATGAVLASALAARPDVVSPNLSEAEAVLLGRSVEVVEPSGPDVVARAARAVVGLVALGARGAIVSAGSHGAAFNLGDRVAWCPAPAVDVVNPIGAGDSLVAGLLHALESGAAWEDAVRRGVVTASATCESPLAGGLDVPRASSLLRGLPETEILEGFAVGKGTPCE